MRSPDWFALGVRLFGVWLITRGAVYVAQFLDTKLYPASGPARDSAAANLIYATLDFPLAAFFPLGTRVIVAWTYGEGRGKPVFEIGDEPGKEHLLEEPDSAAAR